MCIARFVPTALGHMPHALLLKTMQTTGILYLAAVSSSNMLYVMPASLVTTTTGAPL